MHLFALATIFTVLVMIGVELSVALFVDPAAWRLPQEPQAQLLSHLARVLGRVMPFWYAGNLGLLLAETWLHRHTSGFAWLLAAAVLWALVVVATIVFLVPINNRIAARSTDDLERQHHLWDTLHRVRIGLLMIAAVLLLTVLVD